MTGKRETVHSGLPGRYKRMSAGELDAETAKFDREGIADESKPLTKSLQARLRKARRKRGRPRVGKGAKKVLITIERDLLRKSDAFARRKKMSRSEMVARGLEALLASG
jgi:hypothetical protein